MNGGDLQRWRHTVQFEEGMLLLGIALLALMFWLAAVYPSQMTDYTLGARLKERGIPVDDPEVVGVMKFVGTIGACVLTGLLIVLGRACVGL